MDQADYGSLYVRPGIRVSLLRQEPDFGPDETLISVARSGLASLLDIQEEMEEAAREMAEAEDDDDRLRASRRYDELRDRLEHQDAYSVDHRVEEILGGLGFPTSDFSRAAQTFSGGQQSRMMLAKLLLESPDLMLLDEPSNHLDIETTAWLENYLSRQSVGMIVVSHDRYFLDKVVTRIWELYEGKIDVYPGNYTQYWKLRTEKAKVLQRQYEKQQDYIADQEAYIRRYGAGQRAKQAHDREKKLARVERVETMREITGPRMGFGEVDRSGDIVIEARKLTKAYDTPLFKDFNFSMLRGQCVGVLGPNGAGKSTLIKALIGKVTPDSGDVKLGHKAAGRLPRPGASKTLPSRNISSPKPSGLEDEAYDWVQGTSATSSLGFLVFPANSSCSNRPASGGEKGKARSGPVEEPRPKPLVKDEPTNHLDIWACDALERSIREFEGSVLVVSHDRYFLNQVADRIIVVAGGKARVIEGDYETYQHLAEQEAEALARKLAASNASVASSEAKDAPRSDGKSEKRKRKFPYRKVPDLEKEIAEVEAEAARLEDLLAQPATWKETLKAIATQDQHKILRENLARLYEHWEEAVEMNS